MGVLVMGTSSLSLVQQTYRRPGLATDIYSLVGLSP